MRGRAGMRSGKRFAALALTALLITCAGPALCEETEVSMGTLLPAAEAPAEAAEPAAEAQIVETETASPADTAARERLIDDIIAAGKKVYDQAGGHYKRAHYAGDIYVCKNFTVYVFEQCAAGYRLSEFPEKKLSVPANKTAEECKPYKYGYCWKEAGPEEGNPFEIAAQFVYDPDLSKAENMQNALAFMREVRRGDYFQMSADYYYGVGAHSAVMIADYDPDTDTVRWMDSNMKGKSVDGIRYGVVQFDAVKKIEWWADAFCKKGRGATIYRLREDIVFAQE